MATRIDAERGVQVFEIPERRIRRVISAVWGELVAGREDMDVSVNGPQVWALCARARAIEGVTMVEEIRDCLPPDRNPRKPKLVLPSQSTVWTNGW